MAGSLSRCFLYVGPNRLADCLCMTSLSAILLESAAVIQLYRTRSIRRHL